MTAPDLDEATRRFHAACGETVRAWAQLESTLVLYLKTLLSVDQHRARLTWVAMPTIDARLALLRTLGDAFLDDSAQRATARLLDRVSLLQHRRDLLMQAVGGIDRDGTKASFLSDTADPRHSTAFLGRETYDLPSVEAWPQEFAELEQDLIAWLETLTGSIHSSPKAYRPAPARKP